MNVNEHKIYIVLSNQRTADKVNLCLLHYNTGMVNED